MTEKEMEQLLKKLWIFSIDPCDTPFLDMLKEKHQKEKQLVEEGYDCPYCMGHMHYDTSDCYCSATTMPPCGNCENQELICDTCGEPIEEIRMALYYIEKDGKEIYGLKLATGSDGLAIFEERGTGTLHKVDPKSIMEVMPYTYSVKYAGSDKMYHYYGKPGEVAVGDVLINTLTCNDTTLRASNNLNIGGIAVVQALDTKNKNANKFFTGYKLNATMLAQADES